MAVQYSPDSLLQ